MLVWHVGYLLMQPTRLLIILMSACFFALSFTNLSKKQTVKSISIVQIN